MSKADEILAWHDPNEKSYWNGDVYNSDLLAWQDSDVIEYQGDMDAVVFDSWGWMRAVKGKDGKWYGYLYARPKVEPVEGKRLMRLTQDWLLLRSDGLAVLIRAGFTFDGASIPKFYWWRFQPFDPMTLVAALIHDYLYVYGLLGRHVADAFFYHMLMCEHNGGWKSSVLYAAVNHFGWLGYDSDAKRKKLEENRLRFFNKKQLRSQLKK